MNNHNHKHENVLNQLWGFSAGLMVGGLAGVATMLLMAPQSGKKTRAQIQEKSIELRDQMVKTVEGAVAQVRGQAHQIAGDVREQAGELEQRGQDMLDEQRDHLSKTLKGWGKAIQA